MSMRGRAVMARVIWCKRCNGTVDATPSRVDGVPILVDEEGHHHLDPKGDMVWCDSNSPDSTPLDDGAW